LDEIERRCRTEIRKQSIKLSLIVRITATRVLAAGLIIMLIGFLIGFTNPPPGSDAYRLEGGILLFGLLVAIVSGPRVLRNWIVNRRKVTRRTLTPQQTSPEHSGGVEYDVKPAIQQPAQGAESRKEKINRDLGFAARNGFLVVKDNGDVRFTPEFAQVLEENCKIDSDIEDEELLYRIMISIREFRPELPEPDFLAVRRLVIRYALFMRDKWKKRHPDKKEELEEFERTLTDLRTRWTTGFKPGQKQDMLTSIYELQLENAKKMIAEGKNFQPELLMWQGTYLTGTTFEGPDPMTQATALINQTQPEGYSFAAEAWKSPPGSLGNVEKWGDVAKM